MSRPDARPQRALNKSGNARPLARGCTRPVGEGEPEPANARGPVAYLEAVAFGVEIIISANSPMCSVKIAGIEITIYEQQDDAGANCPPGIHIRRVARFLVAKPQGSHAKLSLVRRHIWRRGGHV